MERCKCYRLCMCKEECKLIKIFLLYPFLVLKKPSKVIIKQYILKWVFDPNWNFTWKLGNYIIYYLVMI